MILNRGRKAHGKVETLIIKQLSGKRSWHLTASELAQDIFDTIEPTVAQRVSVRRALRSLRGKGLVVHITKPSGRSEAVWALTGWDKTGWK